MEKDLIDRLVGERDVAPANDGNGCPSACRGYEGCGPDSWGLHGYPLAMVYAPCQSFRALYDPATALSRGTLFSELDLPLGEEKGAFCALSSRSGCSRANGN